jgi:hypothetical protein
MAATTYDQEKVNVKDATKRPLFVKLGLGIASLAICIMGSSLAEAQAVQCVPPPAGVSFEFAPGLQAFAVNNRAPIQIKALVNPANNGGAFTLTCMTGGLRGIPTPNTYPVVSEPNSAIYAFSCPATSDTVAINCTAGGGCFVCSVP